MNLQNTLIELIKEQVFTNLQPGTIVADINNLLTTIANTKLPLNPLRTSFAANLLPTLNANLVKPHKILVFDKISVSFFPHLKGLFLLLRASKLTKVELGKPSFLSINENHYQQWQKLNSAEQYHWLIKSWIEYGHPEIIGNDGDLGDSNSKWLQFGLRYIEKNLIAPDGKKYLEYSPGYANLALMSMFGLVQISYNVSDSKLWNIETIALTHFGKTVFVFAKTREFIGYEAIPSIISQYHPEIKSGIVEETKIVAKGSITLMVKALSFKMKFEVPSTENLHKFLSEILEAIDFDHDHLYAFYIKNQMGVTSKYIHPEMDNDYIFADDVTIGELELSVNQEFDLVYDFGDNCRFKIKVEAINPLSRLRKLQLLDKKGQLPDQYYNSDC